MLRNDIHNCRARDVLRVIEAHAVQHARTPVVAGGGKAIKPECGHHLDLVLRHGAE